jgi:hypothetical protein
MARPLAALTVLAALLSLWVPAPACTTAVVAPSATADGRPLLWKNRDSDDRRNQVVYCADGKYAYVGVVNGGDAAGLDIWAGLNEAGFAIMNSASYNLGKEESTGEGRLMKLALQSCASVEDFQALLERTSARKRDVEANFGVIDGKGGAAYFEVGPDTYRRFNASDPAIAPRGFLVRTNFSESGDRSRGTGFLRRERALSLLEEKAARRSLTAQSLLAGVARDTANVRLGSFPLENRKKGPVWAYTQDSVCRWDTVSAFVAQGPRPGEAPSLATAWIVLGQPLGAAAVPYWVKAASVPPQAAAQKEDAPLTVAARALEEILYPDSRGDLAKYLDVQALTDPRRNWMATLLSLEAQNFAEAEDLLKAWALEPPEPETVAAAQERLAARTLEGLQRLAQPPEPKRRY